MEPIDVDEIAEVNFPDADSSSNPQTVEVVFKNGAKNVYSGPDLAEALAILNHWTPPTA